MALFKKAADSLLYMLAVEMVLLAFANRMTLPPPQASPRLASYQIILLLQRLALVAILTSATLTCMVRVHVDAAGGSLRGVGSTAARVALRVMLMLAVTLSMAAVFLDMTIFFYILHVQPCRYRSP